MHPNDHEPKDLVTPDRIAATGEGARRLLKSRRGMSLVEVMVVIAIILTLMGIIGYGVMSVFSDANVDMTKLTMTKISERAQMYHVRKKKFPGGSDALQEIFGHEPPPTDAWGNPFKFVAPGPNGMEFDIISLGADGREGGSGNDADIRWSEERGH